MAHQLFRSIGNKIPTLRSAFNGRREPCASEISPLRHTALRRSFSLGYMKKCRSEVNYRPSAVEELSSHNKRPPMVNSHLHSTPNKRKFLVKEHPTTIEKVSPASGRSGEEISSEPPSLKSHGLVYAEFGNISSTKDNSL